MNEIQLNEWIQKFPQNLKAKIDFTALAIWNLHQSKFDLGHEDFKNALSYMLRVCSEGSQTHPSAHVISKARLRAPSEAKRHEHMVPVEEVYQTVLRLLGDGQIHSPAELGQFLQRVSLRASILKSEDQKLDRLYKKTMPKEWCVNSNWKNCNPLLRYQVEGIEVVENPSFRDYWKQNQAPRVQNQIKNLQGEMVMEGLRQLLNQRSIHGNTQWVSVRNEPELKLALGRAGFSVHIENRNNDRGFCIFLYDQNGVERSHFESMNGHLGFQFNMCDNKRGFRYVQSLGAYDSRESDETVKRIQEFLQFIQTQNINVTALI